MRGGGHQASRSHRFSRQVESRYLPPNRREDGTLTNFNGERTNPVITMAPQRVFVNTNLVTHPQAFNEPLPLARSMGGTIQPPLGVDKSRG